MPILSPNLDRYQFEYPLPRHTLAEMADIIAQRKAPARRPLIVARYEPISPKQDDYMAEIETRGTPLGGCTLHVIVKSFDSAEQRWAQQSEHTFVGTGKDLLSEENVRKGLQEAIQQALKHTKSQEISVRELGGESGDVDHFAVAGAVRDVDREVYPEMARFELAIEPLIASLLERYNSASIESQFWQRSQMTFTPEERLLLANCMEDHLVNSVPLTRAIVVGDRDKFDRWLGGLAKIQNAIREIRAYEASEASIILGEIQTRVKSLYDARSLSVEEYSAFEQSTQCVERLCQERRMGVDRLEQVLECLDQEKNVRNLVHDFAGEVDRRIAILARERKQTIEL